MWYVMFGHDFAIIDLEHNRLRWLVSSLRTSAERTASAHQNALDLINKHVTNVQLAWALRLRALDSRQVALDKANDERSELSQFAVQAARNIELSLGDTLYDVVTG